VNIRLLHLSCAVIVGVSVSSLSWATTKTAQRSTRVFSNADVESTFAPPKRGKTGPIEQEPTERKPTARKKSVRVEKASDCLPCGAKATATASRHNSGKRAVAVKSTPCHPPDYVDPRVRKDLTAAMRDMKRAGIKVKVNSAWRSSNQQEQMYICSYNQRCRKSHPGLYRALPPGASAHEAGLALDIAGVAAGPRGANHITPQGRRIVKIMGEHGFKWKYGLRDPVHFEADPREHGYRNLQEAIHMTQTRCDAKLAAAKIAARGKKGSPEVSTISVHSPTSAKTQKRLRGSLKTKVS